MVFAFVSTETPFGGGGRRGDDNPYAFIKLQKKMKFLVLVFSFWFWEGFKLVSFRIIPKTKTVPKLKKKKKKKNFIHFFNQKTKHTSLPILRILSHTLTQLLIRHSRVIPPRLHKILNPITSDSQPSHHPNNQQSCHPSRGIIRIKRRNVDGRGGGRRRGRRVRGGGDAGSGDWGGGRRRRGN